jgi:hypothetical protein
MSESKYSGLTKIKVGDKIGTQKEWKEIAASKTGLTVEQVAVAIKAAVIEGFELPADIDKNTAKILAKVMKAAKDDFKAAKDMQAAENQRRAEEAAAIQKRKEEMAALYQGQTEQALVVANDFAGNLNNVIAGSVEDYFVVTEDGDFVLKDEDNAEEAFAAGFARLRGLFEKSRQLGGGFALYEAKLALAAEEKFGNEWPNFFAGTDAMDVRRIQRNMKALKTFADFGIPVGEVPIGTLLALTEVRYDKEDAANNDAIKKKVIEDFIAASEKAGAPLNQKEAKKLVAQATPEKQATAAQKWSYIYIFADGRVAGSNSSDADGDAVLVIDKNQRICVKKEDGTFEYKSIPSIGGKTAEADAAAIAETAAAKAAAPAPAPAAKKAAKKAAGKKADPAPTNVIPMTPEPETKEDADDDDGLGSLDDLLS